MGRKQAFAGEELKERKLRMSDRGWNESRSFANLLSFRGVAPMLEAIARLKEEDRTIVMGVLKKYLAPTVDK